MPQDAPVELAALDLPEIDVQDPAVTADALRERTAELAAHGWLARLPLGVLTLDREAGEHFLRTRSATFPGALLAQLHGIEDGALREEVDRNLLHVDGPDHARLRRLVNPSFTPRAADRWRPAMRGFLERLWTDVEPGDDVVPPLVGPYPSLTIAAVVGAPASDAARLQEWSHLVQLQFDGPTLAAQRAQVEQAAEQLVAWIGGLLEQRRGDPGEDLVSALLAAEAEGDRLSDVELVHLVLDVLIGGVDTTQAQLAHALRLFAAHPDQWALLAAEPERVPAAVQEVLRHEPITPFTARLLTEDVVFRGVRFPRDTLVMVGTLAGNRDGAGPDRFDITADRGDARLLTFGAGAHHCLGAALARAELEEALAFLAPRTPGLRPAGPASLGTVQGIYGLTSLPLAWDPAVRPERPA